MLYEVITTIIFFARCEEGTGREDFIDWFNAENSRALAEQLVDSYKVNGQTAWSLLEKSERFDIRIVTRITSYNVCYTKLLRITAMAGSST